MVRPFPPEAERVSALRAELPATAAGIYLNTGSAGPVPREVARVMEEAAARELEIGRGHRDRVEETAERLDEARAAVAAIVGADLREVAITQSTSGGCAIAAWSIDWRPGDRIVTTNLEHPGGYGTLRSISDRFDVDLAVVDIGTGGDVPETLRLLDAAITARTRLVLISHVAWGTGGLLPIRAIAELAHARGALLVLDAAQSAGTIPVDMHELGADIVSLPAQKWLLGPEGVGALVIADRTRDRMLPSLAGAGNYRVFDPQSASGTLWPDARAFDAPNWYRPAIVGFARSCGWLSMYVGLPWIHERSRRLARAAASRLASIPGVTLITPLDRMATLVSFRVAGWSGEQAVEALGRRIFAVIRAIPGLDAVRISVAFFTTESEIERFCAAVEGLARHTPESLPERPALVILGGEADGLP